MMMRKNILRPLLTWLLCSALFVGPSLASADTDGTNLKKTKPLWEIGLFFGGATLPSYRGSDETKEYALALPYFVYRGEVLSIDRESISGLFYKSDLIEFDTSIFVDLNDDKNTRAGMPPLDPVIFGVGPAIKTFFRRRETAGYNLYLDFPLRAAVSGNIDGGVDLEYRGVQLKINLFYENYKMFGNPACELVAALGVGFYDAELAGYYFDVDEQYVETGGSAYTADAGFAGASASVDLLYRFTDNIAVRAYVRVDSVEGAVFEGSPLVTEPVTFSSGLALMFRIWESERRVQPK